MSNTSIGFWPWFWIWTGLAIGAVAWLLLIAKSLFNKLLEAAHQGGRITSQLEKLAAAFDEKPKLPAVESNLLDDPKIAVAKRKSLLKARLKKKEQRQRRLIASLKNYDPNESRFH